MSQFTAVSLAVEYEGKPYFVALPQDRLKILVKMAASLSDSGSLPLSAAPENFKFMSLGEAK